MPLPKRKSVSADSAEAARLERKHAAATRKRLATMKLNKRKKQHQAKVDAALIKMGYKEDPNKKNSPPLPMPEKRDYVEIAVEYAQGAVEDEERSNHGKWIRLSAVRFLRDYARAKKGDAPYSFSEHEAGKACRFIECLPHVEGEWGHNNLIYLEPAQIFFVVNLFGFRKPDGSRRFNTALFAVARKNAKSTLAAAILIYCFTCEKEQGPQVISAATTGSQARIIFEIARKIVVKTPDLCEEFKLEPFQNAIANYETMGNFKPINAKASTQDGLNPSAVCLDEVHAHKTSDLLDVLKSAAGARKNPLFLFTTTEGYETPGPWPELRNFARQLLEGLVEADHFLAHIYALDDDDEDFDESKWIKANPLLGVSVSLEQIREQAVEAKSMPGRLAEFRIKRLNRQSASASSFIDLMKWRGCAAKIDINTLVGKPCWGAIDLASTRDLTAWRLVWLVEGKFVTWGRFWAPERAVNMRSERNKVPYSDWVAGGYILQTQGDVCDYAAVEKTIIEDCKKFKPKLVAYDDWNAASTANNLTANGVEMVKFIQGARSYHPAMKAFETAYMSGKFAHEDNPVLTWNAANLVARVADANMNMAPDRKRSAEKIDGMVALFMAIGIAEQKLEAKPEPKYEVLFV